MQKNRIAGVEPFNEYHLRSCYYHQLFAGLSGLGIDQDLLLLNSFVFIREDFIADKTDFLNDETFMKKVGYTIVKSNVNGKKIVRCIDKGMPIIVGVDCFYLESRKDTYMTQHAPHFILVYGYDLETNQLNVIDHNYVNSFEYIEKVISMENLLLANKMFRDGIHHRKYTSRILKRQQKAQSFDIWKDIGKTVFKKNQECSLKNLKALRVLLTTDLDKLQEKMDRVARYLQSLKSLFFALSKTRIFYTNGKANEEMALLISGYSNMLSLFWKLQQQKNIEYVHKKKDSIMRKLDEIEALEIKIYEYILEVCQ